MSGSNKAQVAQALDYSEQIAADALPLESELARELHDAYLFDRPGWASVISEELFRFYGDRKHLRRLTGYLDELSDPIARRRIELVRLKFLDCQGDEELWRELQERAKELHEGLTANVPLPFGQPLDHNSWFPPLREPNDKLRHEEYLANTRKRRERAPLLAELLAVRHRLRASQADRVQRDATNPQPTHHWGGADEDQSCLVELRQQTEEPFRAWRARRLQMLGRKTLVLSDLLFDDPGPWNELNAALPDRALESAAAESFQALGFDLDSGQPSITVSHHSPREAISHCFGVRVPRDVRVLLRYSDVPAALEGLWHELGRAVYLCNIEQDAWEFRTPVDESFLEACARLLGRIRLEPQWMQLRLGFSEAQADEHHQRLKERDLVRVRILLLWAAFEDRAEELTRDELDRLWSRLAEEYLGVDSNSEESEWAAIPPITWRDGVPKMILYAELIGAQLWSHYSRHLGSLVGNEALARRLRRDIFRHGARYPSSGLLRKITGQALSPQSYVRALEHNGKSG